MFNICIRAFAIATALFVVCAAGPVRAEWLRAETEHFVIQGDTSRGAISEYARKVERFHEMLALFLPPERDDVVAPKLWIFLARGQDDMQEAWPGIGNGVAGFYSRSDERIYAVVDTRNEGSDHTLFHEYAHHYMFQYHNQAYPGWFVEGFAEYFAPSDMRMGRIRYGLYRPGRMNSLTQTNSWVPMEDVLQSRRTGTSRRQGAAYYAQAWALTHYMLGSPERNAQLSAYLRAVAGGMAPLEALQAHIGRTPEQLADELRSYLDRGITVYTLNQALPEAEVSVTSLPRSTSEAIWLDLRAARPVGEAGPALVERARAIVASHPDDRLPRVALAKLLRSTDDLAGARSALEPLAAALPDDAEVRWLLARVLMEQADAADDAAAAALNREARTHLAAAYEADPLDYRVYIAMADLRSGAPGYPTDNDVVVAESAYRLAPQLGSTAFQAAQVMMARERYLEAAYVLAPLANNPHGGDNLEPVRRLLGEARELAGLAPVSLDAPPDADETADAEASDE